MRLMQIRYFLETAEQKNMTKAAERLYVSQPALSKQMNLLEEELGVRLIRRVPRGILLTEKGEQFAEDCRRILKELDDAVKRVSGKDTSAAAPFCIGCFDGAVVEYEENIISLMSDLNLGNGYCLLSREVADTSPDLSAFVHPDIPGVDVVAVWKETNPVACSLMETLSKENLQ
ncbi:MAG: LysR family transcriptional regulator [Parasporobacterium sp.]|nr:LysR family transcriptional regulator [Parasporobacterium sp.]